MRKVQLAWIMLQVAWTTFHVCVRIIWKARSNPKDAFRYSREPWGPRLLEIAGATLEVDGLERVDFNQPAIYVMNHQSLMDVPSVL